jgi:hypothetical protein
MCWTPHRSDSPCGFTTFAEDSENISQRDGKSAGSMSAAAAA